MPANTDASTAKLYLVRCSATAQGDPYRPPSETVPDLPQTPQPSRDREPKQPPQPRQNPEPAPERERPKDKAKTAKT